MLKHLSFFATSVLVLTLVGSNAWADITEFDLPHPNSGAGNIIVGPDGNLWFKELNGNRIGRFNLADSTISELELPNPNSGPEALTVGPDNNLWFTEYYGNRIGTITPDGNITEFALPNPGSGPEGITQGPDGNLWFTEYLGSRIGMITPQGDIVEFHIPTANSQPFGITAGPDGNLWFTENNANRIGQIATDGVILAEYVVPTPESRPLGITTGPDGNIWFTEWNGNKIGRLYVRTPANHLLITAAATAVSGTPFDVTVTALDPYGKIDTNYQGTATFSTTDADSGVVLPADYTFTTGDNGDNGVHTFPHGITLITAGDQTLTFTDKASGLTGSATVTVGPSP